METTVSFKQRVKCELSIIAPLYKQTLVDYEYLIVSPAFHLRTYYILSSKPDNFLHLTGLNSKLKPSVFFNKCYAGSITEDDFDFLKPGKTMQEIKGSVRRKLKVFTNLDRLFCGNPLWVEEDFRKNSVQCLVAASDNCCTLGFHGTNDLRPKTLLKGNMLDSLNASPVVLLLRKESCQVKFNELVIGNSDDAHVYTKPISTLVSLDF